MFVCFVLLCFFCLFCFVLFSFLLIIIKTIVALYANLRKPALLICRINQLQFTNLIVGSSVSFQSDGIEVIVDTNNDFIFLLTTLTLGDWEVSLDGVSRGDFFHVDVTAHSFLNFKFQMLRKDVRGIFVPLGGLPIAGKLDFTRQIKLSASIYCIEI